MDPIYEAYLNEASDKYTLSASNLFFDKETGARVKVRDYHIIKFVKEHPNGNIEFDFNGQAIIAKQGSLANMLRKGQISKA